MISADVIWMLMVPGAPLITAVVLFVFRPKGRSAGWLAGAGTLASLAALLMLVPVLNRGDVPALALTWVPAAGIELNLHLDWLGLPFALTEAAVTLVAVIYAWGYVASDESTPIFYALLMLFALGMSGTTLADDMVLFYVFWELMLVASCLLILIWGDGEQRGPTALKYFIFTHCGSLLVLVALVILYDRAGADTFSALRGVVLSARETRTLIALFLVGFSVKMAIFPLHLWLPDAHTVAPMPVTIMLAAAMLGMGTYGILRFPMSLFGIEQMATFSVPMMIAGVVSAGYGALMALAEQDVKRIVAYSSVSQMGYVLFGLGTLTPNGVEGATLHVIYHAIVKALLFMVLGLVIHATGKRRLDELGGLAQKIPVVAASAVIGALAIAGMPPLVIFDSEWMIFAGGFETPSTVLPVLAVVASLLTVAYALLLVGRIFFGSERGLELRPRPLAMVAPTVVLAVLAIVEGIWPAPLFGLVQHELSLLLRGIW